MKRRMLAFQKPVLLLLIVLLLLSSTAFASPIDNSTVVTSTAPTEKVSFKEDFTVTSEGGRFEIGFAQVDFRKSFMPNLPITFTTEIYAEDGLVYIEFNPSVDLFFKDVKVHAYRYSGYIYDRALGHNIYVNIPNQVIKFEHFSRRCFVF